jgi:hypothetical protein
MDGLMGAMPDYYPLFVAARVCNSTPWDLAKQSVYWRDKALIVHNAEAYAQAEKERHQ